MKKRNCLKFRSPHRRLATRFYLLFLLFVLPCIPILFPTASFADDVAGTVQSDEVSAEFDGRYIIHLSENPRVRSSDRPEPGYFDSLAIELFTQAGIYAEIVPQMPWKRQMELAEREAGHVIYPTTRSDDREDKFKWVGPVSRTIWNLYGFEDRNWSDTGFEDILESARIGTLMGSAREAYLRERGAKQIVIVPREELLLPMLLADRIDLIAIGGNVLRHYIDEIEQKETGANVPKIDGAVSYRSCYLYIAISGDVPDEDILRLQAQLDAFKRNGFFVKNRQTHGLSTNLDGSFLKAMLDLSNNGVRCIDLAGSDD
ncbi:transporter substrate-binding domain-containing protein [Thalassospira sp. GO-4]|jgi:polar amino acid transport system substrate-binding protein|uniref:substrate-binding periplasmic protein n=1 Tax=Thalassospira sp. GO-4 TaxID=2946605 RepID=UPI0020242CEB|nr:transporter substrate-binding domain-containing protein [Thalassospira sp. GO-4]URK16695.1 transporter substrate-binding domain-containing protein [Thalassospira sp. GO-4]